MTVYVKMEFREHSSPLWALEVVLPASRGPGCPAKPNQAEERHTEAMEPSPLLQVHPRVWVGERWTQEALGRITVEKRAPKWLLSMRRIICPVPRPRGDKPRRQSRDQRDKGWLSE